MQKHSHHLFSRLTLASAITLAGFHVIPSAAASSAPEIVAAAAKRATQSVGDVIVGGATASTGMFFQVIAGFGPVTIASAAGAAVESGLALSLIAAGTLLVVVPLATALFAVGMGMRKYGSTRVVNAFQPTRTEQPGLRRQIKNELVGLAEDLYILTPDPSKRPPRAPAPPPTHHCP